MQGQQPTAVIANAELLIQRVRIFDPISGTFGDTVDMLVRGERIAAVGKIVAPAPGVARLDAAGKFALPGLWDSHVHFTFLAMAGDSAVRRVLAGFVRNGITSVRDAGGQLDTMAALHNRVEQGEIVGPTIYYTGPMLSPRLLGATRQLGEMVPGFAVAVPTVAAIDSVLDGLVARGATMTKAIDFYDLTLFSHLLSAARLRSLRVIVDPGAPIMGGSPVDTALALGVTSFEHGQAAWSSVLRPDLARERDSLLATGRIEAYDAAIQRIMTLGEQSVSRDRLAALAERWARSGAYFSPTLQHAVDIGSPPDAWRRAFTGRMDAEWMFVRELAARGVRILVGQDNVYPDGTLREMDLLASAGVPAAEILRGATIHPAQWLGVDTRVGTLETGKRADILILEEDPLERITNVRSTWAVLQRGRVVFGPAPR